MPKPAKGEVYRKLYNEEQLEAAIQAVQNGMPKRAAAKLYGIPRGTLQFRLQGNFTKTRPGPPTVLTNSEEKTLVEWIIHSSRKGFPRRKEDLLQSVADFLKKSPRPNSFVDNKPGEGWYKLFLKRNPEIVRRTSEAVTSASSNVSEENIKKWFRQIETCLEEEEILHILQDPKRIFNGDETNFLLCPKTSKVLAPKGTRDVYEIDNAPAKYGLTVMFTFSASGVITPPMIIYPLKRNRADITSSVPDEWGIALSSNGWMNKDLFLQYITNVLHPYLVNKNTEFPIILFVDGHKSHINFELSSECKERGIILVALYPNATRILQPADVAAFKPIKSAWKKAVLAWRRENPTKNLTKLEFAPIMNTLLQKYIDQQIIINGFRACGLYPWNPNAINYQKCLGKNVTQSTTLSENRPQRTVTLTDFEKIVGPSIVSHLTSETSDISNCLFKALKDIYDHFKGKSLESVDSTNKNEYLIIDNELMPINDIPIVISNFNNIIEEFNTEPIETNENFELLTANLFDDLEIMNKTETYDLPVNTKNAIEMKNDKQSAKNSNDQSDLKNKNLKDQEHTCDDVVKRPNQITTIAEIHNIHEPSNIKENINIQNEELNDTVHPNSLDNEIETFAETNSNNQNQIKDTKNNKEYENTHCDNFKCNNEMTPPKLRETLNWPLTPQRRGKVVSHNPIYVLTSRKWLEIEEKKKQERETKEKEKEERRKEKEQKKKAKIEKRPKKNKNTKNVGIEQENIENFKIEKDIAEINRKTKEETHKQTNVQERKRNQDDNKTEFTNIKKKKIDTYKNKTENYVTKCDNIDVSPRSENLDRDKIKITEPKPIVKSKAKESNVKILSVVTSQATENTKNIFDENSCINIKVPFVLPKPKPLLSRRQTFRNEEELTSFLNDFIDDDDT